eukprot:scaffold42779_cov191-Amphora_coffeaeformis.AAC.2
MKMTRPLGLYLVAFSLGFLSWISQAFRGPPRLQAQRRGGPGVRLPSSSNNKGSSSSGGRGYDVTDKTSKGLVSALTNLVNKFAPSTENNPQQSSRADTIVDSPPKSPTEVLERIRADYVDRNYLWTGDLDIASFATDCVFQDPTIRFEGRDTFLTNVQNIRKVTDSLLGPCRSELRSIQLVESQQQQQSENPNDSSSSSLYVQTEWRMVGLLQGLPWKPCIDVPGRTKFWMRPCSPEGDDDNNNNNNNKHDDENYAWQVYQYEEEWDIPASQALWQIVKPSGEYPKEGAPSS